MPNNSDIYIPERLVHLGKAMSPVLAKLNATIAEITPPTIPVDSMLEESSDSLRDLKQAMHKLSDVINLITREVVSNAGANEKVIYRSVGRFDAVLDMAMDQYKYAKSLLPKNNEQDARDLLVKIHLHSLLEVKSWLDDLVETLLNPLETLKRKGLPIEGEIKVPLTLTLTTSPYLDSLLRWYEHHLNINKNIETTTQSKVASLGLLGKIGVIATGWYVADSIFGKNENES